MTTKTIYIANGGEEFEDAARCREYERSLEHTFLMLDDELKPTDNINEVAFVRVTSVVELDLFLRRCKYEGISDTGLERAGIYRWSDGGYGYWVDMKKEVDTATKLYHDVKKTFQGLQRKELV